MRKIPTTKLRTGDKVLARDTIYVAVEIDHGECWTECSCYDPEEGRCSGVCLRYANDRVAFRYLKNATDAGYNEKVFVSVTDFTGDKLDNMLNDGRMD